MKVRTRKRGKTWSYAFEAGRVDGKRRVIERGGYATQAEAYAAGTEAFTNWKHGDIGITSERITLERYLHVWVEHMRSTSRPRTIHYYEAVIRCWIVPYLGSAILQDLTPAMLDSWMQKLYQHGYAKGSLTDAKAVLRAALSYAVYPCQLIASNPVKYIQIPRNAPERCVERKIIQPETYRKLLEMWPAGTTMYLPVLILYQTGLRLGELLGLRWEDIDFERGTLTVNRQLNYKKDIAPLKTNASYRTIYLTPDCLMALQEAKELQEMNEDLLGDDYIVCEETPEHKMVWHSASYPSRGQRVHMVCVGPAGGPVVHGHVIRYLHHVGLNSHSFRHTQATTLAEAGVSPVAVAARLGHAATDTTLNLYTHNTDEQQRQIAAILAQKNADKNGNADKSQTKKAAAPEE